MTGGVEIPLPPEPDDDGWPDDESELAEPIPFEADPDLRARLARVHEAAQVQHRAPRSREFVRWSAGGFDPQGRHVGCDGEPAPGGGRSGGCGAAPGVTCRTPGGRYVPGFVHPTRLSAERLLFGVVVDPITVTV